MPAGSVVLKPEKSFLDHCWDYTGHNVKPSIHQYQNSFVSFVPFYLFHDMMSETIPNGCFVLCEIVCVQCLVMWGFPYALYNSFNFKSNLTMMSVYSFRTHV